ISPKLRDRYHAHLRSRGRCVMLGDITSTDNVPCLAMRPRQAALALGVSERTLWDWTHRGDVPHVRRGGTLLYPVDALRRWLDAQTSGEVAVDGGKPRPQCELTRAA